MSDCRIYHVNKPVYSDNEPPEIEEATEKMVEAFLARWPDAEFGPAHIVLSDYNLDDKSIKWCKGLISGALSGMREHFVDGEDDVRHAERNNWWRDHSNDEMIATAGFLDDLLKIPEDDR